MIILPGLKAYAQKGAVRMHMPGHKASEAFLKSFPQAEVDITELPFSDNLLQPEGMIAEAQDAFARVFGVPYARFVTSGSTVSLQILIHASKIQLCLILWQNCYILRYPTSFKIKFFYLSKKLSAISKSSGVVILIFS